MVACRDGDVRLVNSSLLSEGRVEVCRGGVFGTVCDDFWDTVGCSSGLHTARIQLIRSVSRLLHILTPQIDYRVMMVQDQSLCLVAILEEELVLSSLMMWSVMVQNRLC